jgi:hypothetical protein
MRIRIVMGQQLLGALGVLVVNWVGGWIEHPASSIQHPLNSLLTRP